MGSNAASKCVSCFNTSGAAAAFEFYEGARTGYPNRLEAGAPTWDAFKILQVVTKITEYFWNFEADYLLEAFCGVGSDAADRLVLLSHTGAVELKTTTKAPAPYPEARVPAINQEAGRSGKRVAGGQHNRRRRETTQSLSRNSALPGSHRNPFVSGANPWRGQHHLADQHLE